MKNLNISSDNVFLQEADRLRRKKAGESVEALGAAGADAVATEGTPQASERERDEDEMTACERLDRRASSAAQGRYIAGSLTQSHASQSVGPYYASVNLSRKDR